MIKLIDILNELGINHPNKLIQGNKYKVWNTIGNKWEILEFESEYSTYMDDRIVFKTGNGNFNVSKNYIKKGWIKPYIEKLNELQINKPLDQITKLATELVKSFDNEIYWDEDSITYSEDIRFVNPILVDYLKKLGKHEEYDDLYKDFRFDMIEDNNTYTIAMYISNGNEVEFEVIN